MNLPIDIKDVTAQWLTEALSVNYPGTEVKSAQLVDVLWGTGTKLLIEVTYNAMGNESLLPPSVVVKGGFNPVQRETLEHTYIGEVRFYRDVLPYVGTNTAKCYFAGNDAENHQHIVILENLNLRGVEFGRVSQPLSYHQAASILDELAKIHARWWCHSSLRAGGLLADLRYRDPLPDSHMNIGKHAHRQLELSNWQACIRAPRGAVISTEFHDRARMKNALRKLSEFSHGGPTCVLHGDPHLGNLYFDRGGKAALLDWQGLAKGHWSRDVPYFLVSSLDISDRRRWDAPLVAYYLERLKTHGVIDPPSFESAWDAYRRQILDGLFYWLVNTIDMQSEENNCAVTPRFAAAALDLGTLALLEA
jgi:hypothetical protein